MRAYRLALRAVRKLLSIQFDLLKCRMRHDNDRYLIGLHFKLTAFYNCLRLRVTIYTVFTIEKFIVTIVTRCFIGCWFDQNFYLLLQFTAL
jgi:hypothetical protein